MNSDKTEISVSSINSTETTSLNFTSDVKYKDPHEANHYVPDLFNRLKIKHMKTDNTIQLVLVNDFSGRNHDGSRESRLINKLANSLCAEILSFREKKYGERFKRGVNYEELHYGIKLFGDRLNHKGSSVLVP